MAFVVEPKRKTWSGGIGRREWFRFPYGLVSPPPVFLPNLQKEIPWTPLREGEGVSGIREWGGSEKP
jgi:hypothetical protein